MDIKRLVAAIPTAAFLAYAVYAFVSPPPAYAFAGNCWFQTTTSVYTHPNDTFLASRVDGWFYTQRDTVALCIAAAYAQSRNWGKEMCDEYNADFDRPEFDWVHQIPGQLPQEGHVGPEQWECSDLP